MSKTHEPRIISESASFWKKGKAMGGGLDVGEGDVGECGSGDISREQPGRITWHFWPCAYITLIKINWKIGGDELLKCNYRKTKNRHWTQLSWGGNKTSDTMYGFPWAVMSKPNVKGRVKNHQMILSESVGYQACFLSRATVWDPSSASKRSCWFTCIFWVYVYASSGKMIQINLSPVYFSSSKALLWCWRSVWWDSLISFLFF